MEKGLLIVISGPAGSGKGTVNAHLLARDDFVYSVSATTRAPRPGEIDGVSYHFVTEDRFQQLEDIYAAMNCIDGLMPHLKAELGHCYMAGDSAGAMLDM